MALSMSCGTPSDSASAPKTRALRRRSLKSLIAAVEYTRTSVKSTTTLLSGPDVGHQRAVHLGADDECFTLADRRADQPNVDGFTVGRDLDD